MGNIRLRRHRLGGTVYSLDVRHKRICRRRFGLLSQGKFPYYHCRRAAFRQLCQTHYRQPGQFPVRREFALRNQDGHRRGNLSALAAHGYRKLL